MRAPQILCTLLALALLVGALVVHLSGQQPEEKPQEHKPLVLRPIPSNSTTNDSGPIEIENLEVLASRLLHHAPDAGCYSAICTILVTDFVFPEGSTFPYGIKLADDLSSLFASQEKTIQVIDRSLLNDHLQKEAIFPKLENWEPAARWLGKKFDATVVLVGQARMVRIDAVELSARFLNVNDKNLIGLSSEASLQIVASKLDFSSFGGPPAPPSLPETVNGEKVYQGGVNGVGLPNCYYMPSPPYTEAAREANFSGIITVEAEVGTDGSVTPVRIVRGAPFGLSEAVVKTIKTWKCKPALLDGKPVATIVPMEMNFRSSWLPR